MSKRRKNRPKSEVYGYRIHIPTNRQHIIRVTHVPANEEHIIRVLEKQEEWVQNKLEEYNERYTPTFEDETLQNLQECVPIGFTEELDRYYDYIAGRISSGEKPRLMIPEKYKDVILEIESMGRHGFTKVTKALLDNKIDNLFHWDILCEIDQISLLIEKPQIKYSLEALSAYGKWKFREITYQKSCHELVS